MSRRKDAFGEIIKIFQIREHLVSALKTREIKMLRKFRPSCHDLRVQNYQKCDWAYDFGSERCLLVNCDKFR